MKKDNSGISQPTTTNQASQPPTSMTYQSTTYTRPKDKPMLLVDIFTRPVYDDIQLWKILYEKPKDIDFKLPRTFAGIVKGAVMKYIAVGDPANAEGEPTLSDGSANNRDNLRYVEIDGTPSLQLQRTNLKAGNTDIELTGVDEDDKRNKLKSIKHVDDDIITTIEGPDIDIPKPNLYGYSITDSTKPVEYNIDWDKLKLLTDDNNNNNNPDVIRKYYSALYYKHPELNIEAPNLDIEKPNVKGTSITESTKPVEREYDNISSLILNYARLDEYRTLVFDNDVNIKPENELDIIKPNLNGDNIHDKIELNQVEVDPNLLLLDLNRPEWIVNGILRGVQQEKFDVETNDIDIIPPNLKGDNVDGDVKVCSPGVDEDSLLIDLNQPQLKYEGILRKVKDEVDVQAAGIDVVKPDLNGNVIDEEKVTLVQPEVEKDLELLVLDKDDAVRRYLLKQYKRKILDLDVYGPELECERVELKGDNVKDKIRLRYPIVNENEVLIDIKDQPIKGIIEGKDEEVDIKAPELVKPNITYISGIIEGKKEEKEELEKPDIDIVKPNLPGYPIKEQVLPLSPGIRKDEPLLELEKPKPQIISGIIEGVKPKDEEKDITVPEFDIHKPNLEGDKIKEKIELLSPSIKKDESILELEKPKIKEETISGIIEGIKPTEDNITIPALDINKPNLEGEKIKDKTELLSPGIKSNEPILELEKPKPQIISGIIEGIKPQEEIITTPSIEKPKDEYELIKPDINIIGPNLKGTNIKDKIEIKPPQLDPNNKLLELKKPTNILKGAVIGTKDPNTTVPTPSLDITKPNLKGTNINDKIELLPPHLPPTEQLLELKKPEIQKPIIDDNDDNNFNIETKEIDIKGPFFDINLPERQGQGIKEKENEIKIPKLNLNTPPIVKDDTPEIEFKPPVLNIEEPKIETDVNIKKPEIKIPKTQPIVHKTIEHEIPIEINKPEVKLPVIKGGVLDLHAPLLSLSAPEFNLRKPNVDGSKIKSKVKEVSPEYDTNNKPTVESPKSNKGFSLKGLIGGNLPGILNLNKNKPEIKPPIIGNDDKLKGPTIKGGIDVDNKQEIKINAPNVELNKPDLKGPKIKETTTEHNITKPTIKEGLDIEPTYTPDKITIPTIKGVDDNMKLSLPKRRNGLVDLITRPLDEELNVNKKEIHKPKDIPFKMPELVVPVPSIGEGIDVNAPKIDTITTPQLKGGIDVNEGNINISEPYVDVNTPTVPILKGGININSPSVDINGPKIDGVNVPNIDGGLDINLNKPDNFVEMIQKPVEHELKLGKVDISKPKELEVNVPEEKLAINWKKEIPNLKGGINVDTPTVDVPEITGVEVVVPNINGGLDIELPNKPDNFVEMIQKPVDHELKLGKVDIPKPKELEVNVPEEKLAINWKKQELQVGIDTPAIAVPSLGAGIDLQKPKVESEIDVNVPTVNIETPSIPSIQGGLDIELPNKPDNFVELIQKPVEHELKLGKVDIPKPKELEVSVPEEKLAYNWKKPELQGGIDSLHAVSVPTLEAGIDVQQPKIEGIDINSPNMDMNTQTIPILKGGINTPNLYINTPEIQGTDVNVPNIDGGLDINLNKPDNFVELIQKPVEHELKLGKVDIPKPKELEVNVPEEKLAINWRKEIPNLKEGINVETPTVDVPEIKGVEVNVPNIDGGLDVDLSNKPDNFVDMIQKPIDHELKLGKVDITKPKELEVNVPEEKLAINWKKEIPNLKGGINVDTPTVDVPEIKGVEVVVPDINGGLDIELPNKPDNFVEMIEKPVDHDLKLGKVDIPKPKELEVNVPEEKLAINWKKPELQGGINAPVVEVPSLGTGIDIQQPKVETDIDVNSPSLDIVTPTIPILKGGINTDTPTVDLKDGVDLNIPNIQAGLGIDLPNKPDNFVEMIQQPVDHDINLGKLQLPKPKEIEVNVPEDKLAINLNKPGLTLGIDAPAVEVSSLGAGINQNIPNIETGVDLNIPNIEGGLNIDLPDKPNCFVEMIQQPVDHDITLGKLQLPKPEEIEVNVPEDKRAINLNKPELKLGIDAPTVAIPSLETGIDKPTVELDSPEVDINPPELNIPSLKGGINKSNIDVKSPELKTSNLKLPDISGGIDVNFAPQTKRFVDIIQRSVKEDINLNKVDFEKPKEIEFTLPKPSFGLQSPRYEDEFKPQLHEPSIRGTIGSQKQDVDIDFPIETNKKEITLKAPQLDDEIDFNIPQLKEPHIRPPYVKDMVEIPVTTDIKLDKIEIPRSHELNVTIPRNKLNNYINNQNIVDNIDTKSFKLPQIGELNMQKPKLEKQDKKLNGKIIGKVPEVDVGDSSIKLNKPQLKGPNNKGEFELDMPKLDLNAPSLDIKKPDLKGSNIKGNVEVKPPEIKIQKPKKDDLNIKGVIPGNIPNIEVKKPKLFFEMAQEPVECDIKLDKFEMPKPDDLKIAVPKGNIKPPQLKIEKEKPKIIMPSLEKEMVIQKPQLKAPHIQEPEIKIKEAEIKIKEPEIKIKEPEIKIKEPEIDINIKEPEINIKEPKINLNFENPQFIESIENEGDEINLNKFEPQGISLKGVIKGKEENIPNIDKPQIEFNQKIPEDKKGRKAEGNQKYLIDMVEIPVEDDIKIDKLELKRTNEIDVTIPRDLLFNDIRNSHLKGNQPSSDLNTAKIQMPSISGNLDINKPKIKLEGPNLNLKNPELNLPDFKGNNIDIHDIDIKPPELKDSNYGASFNLKSPEIDIKKQQLKDSNNVIGSLDLLLPKLQESHTSLKPEINIKDSVNINLPKQEEQNIPNLELKSPEIKLKGSALSNVNPKESIDFENPLMKGIIQGNTKDNMKKSNAQSEVAIEMDKILPEEFEDLNDRYLIRMLEEPVEKQIKLDKINIKKSNLVDITVPRDRLSGKLITSDLGSSKLKNSSIIDNNPSIPEPRFSATHKKK